MEGLLRPVDRALATAGEAGLGDRVGPRREEHRYPAARGVDDAAERVGRADDHVDHDGLRPAGDHGVAVGHRDGRHLVGDCDRTGKQLAVGATARVGLDDRREVGSGVAEEVLDAPGREELEVRLCRGLDVRLLAHECPRSLTSDRKSTRLNSSHSQISYAVFCLKKKKKQVRQTTITKTTQRRRPRPPPRDLLNVLSTEALKHSITPNKSRLHNNRPKYWRTHLTQ